MEEDRKLKPPRPRHVARRAMILSAIVCRANTDHKSDDADAEALFKRLNSWLTDLRLRSQFEDYDSQVLGASFGEIDEELRKRCTWHVEGLSILAWALSRGPFPSFDGKVDSFEITKSLDFLSGDARKIIRKAKLRPLAQLKACREILFATHSRINHFIRQKEERSVESWFEPAWFETLRIDSIVAKSGDIAIGSRSLTEFDEKELFHVQEYLADRHQASIWLIGEEGPGYWDVIAGDPT